MRTSRIEKSPEQSIGAQAVQRPTLSGALKGKLSDSAHKPPSGPIANRSIRSRAIVRRRVDLLSILPGVSIFSAHARHRYVPSNCSAARHYRPRQLGAPSEEIRLGPVVSPGLYGTGSGQCQTQRTPQSGDPYLASAIPAHATKHTHHAKREQFK